MTTKKKTPHKVVPLRGPRDCPIDVEAFNRQLQWERSVLKLVRSLSLLLEETEASKDARAYVRQMLAVCLESDDEPFEVGLQRLIQEAQRTGLLQKPTGPRGVPSPRNKKDKK